MPTNDTDVGVASVALTIIGANAITSFSDATTEAEIVSAIYEDLVEGLLCETRWRFSTAQSTLSHLAAAPTGRWTDAWQLPSGYLQIHTITVNDYPIEYDIYGSKAYCDYDENNTLIADYTWRAAESQWTPTFKVAFQMQLAALLAPALRADWQLAKELHERAGELMKHAKSSDAQQQTTRKMRTNRFTGRRVGG